MNCRLFQPLVLFCFFSAGIWGCKDGPVKEDHNTDNKKYSLYIIDKEGTPYIVQTDNISSGKIDPSEQSLDKGKEVLDRDLIVKNGFYYKFNPKNRVFTKYQGVNGKLKKVASTQLSDFYLDNYSWINEDSLLLLDMTLKGKEAYLIAIKLNVNTMKAEKVVTSFSVFHGNYNDISVGLSKIENGHVLIGFTLYTRKDDGYRASDTAYFATLAYPSLKVKFLAKDSRSVQPGGENAVEPGSFTDENGDYYYLTCPGVALGNYIEKPTALCRIKANTSQPDTAYFFNISASPIQNHAYSVYYLGKRKAIIRNERKDLFTRWDQHWKVPHFEFYLVDIDSQSVKKLNLPLDKGTRRWCVLNEGDSTYISISSDSAGHYIWKYNPETNELSKGLQLTGPASYILRLDRLN